MTRWLRTGWVLLVAAVTVAFLPSSAWAATYLPLAGKPITSTCGGAAAYLIDGNTGSWWDGSGYPCTVTVDLGAPTWIAGYALVWGGSNQPSSWAFETSTDGTTWTALDSTATGAPTTAGRDYPTTTVQASQVRWRLLSGDSGHPQFVELRLIEGTAPASPTTTATASPSTSTASPTGTASTSSASSSPSPSASSTTPPPPPSSMSVSLDSFGPDVMPWLYALLGASGLSLMVGTAALVSGWGGSRGH